MEGSTEVAPIQIRSFHSGWIGIWFHIRFESANSEIASEKSCGDLGWQYWSKDGLVCGASTTVGCVSQVSFSAAQYTCVAAGGRLCTLRELNNGAALSSGCGYDATRVWAASKCITSNGTEGAWTQAGNPSNANGALSRYCTELNMLADTRCCADKVPVQGGKSFVSLKFFLVEIIRGV
jgi:hypothetical protein